MRLTGAARWPIETAFRRPVSAKLTAVVMKYSHSAVAKYFVIMFAWCYNNYKNSTKHSLQKEIEKIRIISSIL